MRLIFIFVPIVLAENEKLAINRSELHEVVLSIHTIFLNVKKIRKNIKIFW